MSSSDTRLVDLELYGWTRTDLMELARTSGLRLEVYQPAETEYVEPRSGAAPAMFDLALPRSANATKAPGGYETSQVLLVLGSVTGILATFALGMLIYSLITDALPGTWGGIAATLANIPVIAAMFFVVITGYERLNHQRHPPPESPDVV